MTVQQLPTIHAEAGVGEQHQLHFQGKGHNFVKATPANVPASAATAAALYAKVDQDAAAHE